MRLRFAVPASLLATLALAAVPASSVAKGHVYHPPHHNHGLTIRVTENPINEGDSILIYGQLTGTPDARQTITLWHHISGSGGGYTVVQRTTTDSAGFYSFLRAPGVVDTNRSWFATAAGGLHSRTLFERVHAVLTISAPSSGLTNSPVSITGHVAPNHAFERVQLQQQVGGTGDDWQTIAVTHLGPGSNYSFSERFKVPGDRTLRAVFGGDGRNIRGASDEVSVAISQNQNAAFTLNSSDDPITVGQTATLTGTLAAPKNGSVAVTLYARPFNNHKYTAAQNGMSDPSGNYSFTVAPESNTVYEVRTGDGRTTRQLFLGVHDSLTITPSSTTSTVDGSVTFTGTVAPSKVGHVIELQRRGPDGDWHTVKNGRVGAGSSYSFNWTFGTPGTKTFRVRVPGGPVNEGGVSSSVVVTVSEPAISSLPTAS